MNLPLIAIKPAVAREHFLNYRRAVRLRAEREDETLMRGYRELAKGRRVLSGAEAIAQGGIGADGLPALAITRADAERCFVQYDSDGEVIFGANDTSTLWGRTNRTLVRRFPRGTLPTFEGQFSRRRGEARVPLIPPHLRPAHKLSNYFILWEATWSRIAPKDPALLKDIGGGLYVVLAIWDLTELERAVIGLRG